MKFLIATTLLILSTLLHASLHDRSAIVYYGKDISYPMVGVHDYIIVQPSHINTSSHGFEIYREKLYAYVSIGEISPTTPEYKKIKKEWILAENSLWKSKVLDLKNREYIKFLFEEMIEPQRKRGFTNFFFDTLDSYQLASTNREELAKNAQALALFINEFHKRYPHSKLVINRGFEVIDAVHDSVEAVLFESYYRGIGGEKLGYKEVSSSDREWLDIHINKIQSYGLDVICVDYLPEEESALAKTLGEKIYKRGMIPYVGNRDLDNYGVSSKNAFKREIFFLIDESKLDRLEQGAVMNSGTVLEYMGYIQKFYNAYDGLPKMKQMRHYAGVIIWMQSYYKYPEKLMKWVKDLSSIGVKVVFANNFATEVDSKLMKPLGISIEKKIKHKKKILKYDKMMGYEIEPSHSVSSFQIKSKKSKALLQFEFQDGTRSTPAAITSWGGYALEDAFMITINEDNLWVINPFLFFKEALRLRDLIVPDVTTENGVRLFFSHIDGDGMMNRVEGDFGYYSGDVILNKILKVYQVPHSVSVIGSEISPDGLYPKIFQKLISIAKEMYALENVEPATHTFTHPFFWGKIKNNHLDAKYRLKPKGYEFSLENELSGTLEFINRELHPKREAQGVFWSGDCIPRENALSYISRHNILNINGGDTIITKMRPWILGIAPAGLMRSNYIQVFTGAQNENVFTNDWLGPFWGFKRVTQTFEMTNSPRRYKPIDIYYHIYSGSKKASLSALTYIFDWVLKQDIFPLFTSEYIPKAMDYYTASLANEQEEWLVSGLKDLKTIRIEKRNASVDFNKSASVVGVKHFENHTYLSLVEQKQHYITLDANATGMEGDNYLIAANAKISSYEKNATQEQISFEGHVDLKLDFHLKEGCFLSSEPLENQREEGVNHTMLSYENVKKATLLVRCSH